MKKISLILLLFLFATCFGADVFENEGLYGLKNEKGNIILNPEYQKIVQLKYTPTKAILIPMQATKKLEEIKTENYKVKKDGKWGLVDNSGKILLKNQYEDIKINEFGEISVIKNGKEELLNPAKNAAKATAKTAKTIVGLPVTIVAGAMIPVEILSDMSSKQ